MNIKNFCICVGLLFFSSVNAGLGSSFAYVGNYNNNTISIVNTTTNTVTGLVSDPNHTFNAIYYIIIAPNGKTAYVANYPGPISIIDTATNTVTGTISNPNLTNIESMAITPDGTKLYTVQYTTINIIDTATNTVIATLTGFTQAYDMAITPDGKTGYIVDDSTSTVDILDVATNTITGQIPLTFNGPFAIAITPDGKQLYVVNNGNNTISVVNIPANTLAQTITNVNFNNIYWIAITPDGTTAYVNNFDSDNVFAINTTTYAVTNIPGGSNFNQIYYGAITPDGKSYYVVSYNESVVSIINTATNTVAGIVADPSSTFNGPYPLAMSPLLQAPSTATGCKTKNIFLTQTDLINTITWTPPFAGTFPISYSIYRDAALTNLAGTVSAYGPLQFLDHNRQPNVVYTYYIVSIDQNNNVSSPEIVTVTQNC